MKILSIVVPSYNAEKYLDRSIPSLVVGGEEVEVIIVNDGSKDNTLPCRTPAARHTTSPGTTACGSIPAASQGCPAAATPEHRRIRCHRSCAAPAAVRGGVSCAAGVRQGLLRVEDGVCGNRRPALLRPLEGGQAHHLPDTGRRELHHRRHPPAKLRKAQGRHGPHRPG